MCDWKAIAGFAQLYATAAKELNRDSIEPNDLKLSIPRFTLESFSCELYLKALCSKERIEYKKIHGLKDLFLKLKTKDRNAIMCILDECWLKENMAEHKMTENEFLERLDICSDVFPKGRYMFEEGNRCLSELAFLHFFTATLEGYIKFLAKEVKDETAI